jgi:hypothetical protein
MSPFAAGGKNNNIPRHHFCAFQRTKDIMNKIKRRFQIAGKITLYLPQSGLRYMLEFTASHTFRKRIVSFLISSKFENRENSFFFFKLLLQMATLTTG